MLEDILQALHPETYLCIATTLPTEYIKTKRASAGKENIDLHAQQTLHFYYPQM
jgi:16S rRNA (cytidine1402-2'-O)-methyltransferase